MTLLRLWRAARAVCGAALATVAVACGSVTSPGDAPVARVQLSDTAVAVRTGDDAALVAHVRDAGGRDLVGRPIFWASHDTTIATVSQSGVVHGKAVGTTQIAASTEGQSAVATVTVLTRPLASLQIDPATVQLVVQGQQRLTVRALNDAGGPATTTVTWTSTDTTIVRVSADGVVVGVGQGVGSVRATAEGVAATVPVVVTLVPVASVRVTPATASLLVGATQQLTATPLDAAGNALAGRDVSWTSRDPGIAAVSSTGQVTGLAPGTATLAATVGAQTATAVVTVRPVPVATVTVVPNTTSIGVGGSVRLAAVTTDAAGNALTGRAVTYTSSAPTVARVAADGTVTGVAGGTATISAVSEGVTGTATVRVAAAAVVASVDVTPATTTLTVGDTRALVATPRASDGSVVNGRSATWSSSATGVVTVSPAGVVTAVAPGTAQVLAQVDGVTGTATVTVQRTPVASVVVTPGTASVAAGASVQLAAAARDAARNTLSGRAITWASSDNAVATVTSDGRVTGAAPGTVTIRATSEGVTGTATVTITAVVRVGPGTVSVRDRGSLSERTAQLVATDQTGRVLTNAEVTWSSSNPGIASVDANGLVTGVSSQGSVATATITVTYRGATETATARVTRN